MIEKIRCATLADIAGIKALYLDVTKKYPNNLSPFEEEVTDDFIYDGLKSALERGAAMVMENETKEIIAYFKGYTSKNIRKAHILDNMTIIIHSHYENSLLAFRFVQKMFENLGTKIRYIHSARCIPHLINTRSIKVLEKIGMKQAGLHQKALWCKNGSFVDEVTLVWENPHFSYSTLLQYHQYLLSKYSNENSFTFEQEDLYLERVAA